MVPNAGIMVPLTKLLNTNVTMITAGVRPAAVRRSVTPSRVAAVVMTAR